MKRFLPHLIAALAAAFGTAALGHAEILIGVPGALTGAEAWLGEQLLQGTGLKVAELNEAAVYSAQQIELLPVDDYGDPDQAIAAARKLVEARVAAVIGHVCSGAAIPRLGDLRRSGSSCSSRSVPIRS